MAPVLTHTEAGRKASEQSDGTWSAAIWCECGWRRVVMDRPNEDAAELALHAAWVVHSGRA